MRYLLLSCVAVCGCQQASTGPVAPAPANGDTRVLTELREELRALRGELDRTRQEVSEQRQEVARSSAATRPSRGGPLPASTSTAALSPTRASRRAKSSGPSMRVTAFSSNRSACMAGHRLQLVELVIDLPRQLPQAQQWLERFNAGLAKIQKNGSYAWS